MNGRIAGPHDAVGRMSAAKTAEVPQFRVRHDSAKFAEHVPGDCGLKVVLLFFCMEGNVTSA